MIKRIVFVLLLTICPFGSFAQDLSTLYKTILAVKGAVELYKAYKVTDEELAEYMKVSMQQMDKENKVLPQNSKYTQRLNRLTKGMTSVDGIKLNFKVYQSNEANAFASPDGSVRVYSKLMDIMTDNEILGILGHEMGHLAHRDSKNEYRVQLISEAIRDGLMMNDGTIGEMAASTLGDIGQLMINTKYSRRQESAADDYGYDYLKKHGINPWAMAQAFEKLKSIENDTSNKYLKSVKNLLSTHPDLDTRIEAMSNKAKADGYKKPNN